MPNGHRALRPESPGRRPIFTNSGDTGPRARLARTATEARVASRALKARALPLRSPSAGTLLPARLPAHLPRIAASAGRAPEGNLIRLHSTRSPTATTTAHWNHSTNRSQNRCSKLHLWQRPGIHRPHNNSTRQQSHNNHLPLATTDCRNRSPEATGTAARR